MKTLNIKELRQISNEVRKDIIEMTYYAKSGHPGGALSCTDIITTLYFNEMNIDLNNESRDRFVLSKGHSCLALYGVFAEYGFIKKEDLKTIRKLGSILQGHPDMRKVPGIEMSTGSLGQGLSCANGMAMSAKLNKKGYRVYCLVGDGELEEGQIWEAAMTSSHYKLDNLCLIIDNNNLQIDGKIADVMNVYPIDKKLESFGFEIININGHDFEEIIKAFEVAKQIKGKPTAIIAKTIKGKGVSFMENQSKWHGKAPNEEEYNIALEELKTIKLPT